MKSSAMPSHRATSQVLIGLALVAVFIYGRWALLGDDFSGGFAQCFPVALIATLLLDRIYALLAIAGAVASAFLLYFNPPTGSHDDWRLYFAAAVIVLSVAIIAGIGLWQRRTIDTMSGTIERLELLNDELRGRVADGFTAARALSPDPAGFETAEDYHREWSARLAALAGAAEILRHDIEDQRILPDLAESAVLPFAPDGPVSIHLPRCILPRTAVVPLALMLQRLTATSLRAGALADREGKVRVSGSLLPGGRLDVTWRESGPRAGSSGHLSALDAARTVATAGLSGIEARIEGSEYCCTMTMAGAIPR